VDVAAGSQLKVRVTPLNINRTGGFVGWNFIYTKMQQATGDGDWLLATTRLLPQAASRFTQKRTLIDLRS